MAEGGHDPLAAGERGARGLPQGRASSRSPSVKVPTGRHLRGRLPARRRSSLAAAGGDGIVRLIDPETGSIVKEFAPGRRPDELRRPQAAPVTAGRAQDARRPAETETLPAGAVARGARGPAQGRSGCRTAFAYAQLWSPASSPSGETIDVTRMVEPKLSADVVAVSRSGLVRPKADGQATLTLSLAGKTVDVPVTVSG